MSFHLISRWPAREEKMESPIAYLDRIQDDAFRVLEVGVAFVSHPSTITLRQSPLTVSVSRASDRNGLPTTRNFAPVFNVTYLGSDIVGSQVFRVNGVVVL